MIFANIVNAHHWVAVAMVHLQMTITIAVVPHLRAHTAQEGTESVRLEEVAHLHMMSIMIEVMLDDRLRLAIHIPLPQEDMKKHMTVGLLLLLLEAMILTLVEILTLGLEALLLLELMAAMAAAVVAVTAATMIDGTRQVCLQSIHVVP